MQDQEADVPTITLGGSDGPGQLVLQDEIPTKVFVFPLTKAVPFPSMMMPLLLDAPGARELIAKVEAGNGHILMVAQRDGSVEKPGPEDLYDVGVVAKVMRTINMPDGTSQALCQGLRRAKIVKFVRKKPNLIVQVKPLVEIPPKGKRAEAALRQLRQTLGRVIELSTEYGEDHGTAALNIDQADQLADFAGTIFIKNLAQRQQILAAVDVGKRVELALEFLTAELDLAELGQKIQDEIRERAEKAQKEYLLREQLKIIRRELGEETDAREAELERLQKAVEETEMPEVARERCDQELARLRTTPVESGEYGVIRNYLDWLTALPWSVSTKDVADIQHAAKVLDEDHYGLQEVKERILEFLAVRKLQPGHAGSILCLAGPPGVGKTSLGRSIARAMGREFWRFSLGGMRDEAEIKGHRRTYIGAMPGRILQGLKACGANNPVLMLDEIDKLGSDHRGDPSSALLEVLDPEQNHQFLDHYLDVPIDLSKVMFVATANVLPDIPGPLRDRMEIIDIPGYLLEEKVEIARRHLVPKQIQRHGLKRTHLSLGKPTLREVTRLYTMEAGVRGLEKSIQRLCRKAASAVATRRKPPGKVEPKHLEKLLGLAKFTGEGERRVRGPGVVQGLSWTPYGGDVLFVEAAASSPGKGGLMLTGRLGDVMAESARIAHAFLRSRSAELGIDQEFLTSHDFNVHFPAGAIPKDGPSAGIGIATALLSLAKNQECPSDLAMTGEMTLVGEVLPIGGVREKVLAARQHGLERVILPAENRRDVEEMPPELVRGLRFVYVDEFTEVVAEVFGRRPRATKKRVTRRKKPVAKVAKRAVTKRAGTKKPARKKKATRSR